MSTGFANEVASLGEIGLHHESKIDSVIWLHQNGAPSSMDLFDYKPYLHEMDGQDIPEHFLQGVTTSSAGGIGKLYVDPKRTWKQYGKSQAWFSDLLPNLAECADDMTFLRSCKTVGATHSISILKMNTGELRPGRPSLGAWVSYALGSRNSDLPPYVVMYNRTQPRAGTPNWSAGFLPAMHQGTAFLPGESPILYLQRPDLVSTAQQHSALSFLKEFDSKNPNYQYDTELQARLRTFGLAERMQQAAAQVVDVKNENEETKQLYGIDDPISGSYGQVLLRARRLVENGVRFVHVISGHPEGDASIVDWDAHSNLPKNHTVMAGMVDKPIAGLIKDLKARGLLERTLVVWAQEFGRTPWGESGNGRDHNPYGYTQWMAGGGLKKGFSYGATDEIGLNILDPNTAVDTYDLHATVLHLMGLDHMKTTFVHNNRAERPTVNFGKVVHDVLI
ncbi:DUF1501 domain-containing protein [Catenovulum sediminis]|nr:DUF1501 domain-containing protein [Catenovulum sediminis]